MDSGFKFELFLDVDEQYRWHLRASNGKLIAACGEGYINRADAVHGIHLVRREAANAEFVDQAEPVQSV